MTEVVKAQTILKDQGIESDVYSVTSWSELARDGLEYEKLAIKGQQADRRPFIETQLMQSSGPIVAASDYVRALPETIRAYLPLGRKYVCLGTDGFGRSDTRSALREFFQVDAAHIAEAALYALK